MHKGCIFSFNPPKNATRYFHLGVKKMKLTETKGRGVKEHGQEA